LITSRRILFTILLRDWNLRYTKRVRPVIINGIIYHKHNIVMSKGEEGDCMYILFSGEVGVYLTENKCLAQLKENKVFGERALDTKEKRGATIIAHKSTVCLILMKNDYLDIIYVCTSFVLLL
jgi:CRP-like cAMP-binding protein